MLRDPERPADHRAASARVLVRHRPDRRRRHPGLTLGVGERVGLDRPAIVVEARRRVLDELAVLEPRRDDLAPHRVGERDVRADVERRPELRPLHRARPSRVDGEHPRTVPQTAEQVMKEDRVRLARVRSPQQYKIGLFTLLVRARPAARAEYRRQPGDAGRVSGTVAAVDVVAADDAPRKLLRDEVRLVRALRAAEETERLRTVPVDDAAEAGGRPVERLVPGGRTQTSGLADQRLSQPTIRSRHAVTPLHVLIA